MQLRTLREIIPEKYLLTERLTANLKTFWPIFGIWLTFRIINWKRRNLKQKFPNKDAVTISAELPGVKENDIDVQISSDGYLTISAEKRSETEKKEKNNYFSEIYYGSVQRTVPLPWDLDFQKADADYNDGILKIAIPKTQIEKSKVKKINVKKAKKQ